MHLKHSSILDKPDSPLITGDIFASLRQDLRRVTFQGIENVRKGWPARHGSIQQGVHSIISAKKRANTS